MGNDKYIIVNSYDLNEVVKMVNQLITHEYVPQGGISVSNAYDVTKFIQAMFLEEKKE